MDYNGFDIISYCMELKRCYDFCQSTTPVKDVKTTNIMNTLANKYSTFSNSESKH